MSRYNHFSEEVYQKVMFTDIAIGEKFRQNLISKGGRRRVAIVMIKTGDFQFCEERSGRVHILFSNYKYEVLSYDKKATQTITRPNKDTNK